MTLLVNIMGTLALFSSSEWKLLHFDVKHEKRISLKSLAPMTQTQLQKNIF